MTQEEETRWRRLGMAAGSLGVGAAVVVGAVIASQGNAPGPSEPERAIAVPALFATTGAIAALAARSGRGTLVRAAGLLFITGSIISVITFGFAVLGVVLVAAAARIGPRASRRGAIPDWLVASAIVVLVMTAAVGLLGTTEARCSVAFGSSAEPTWQTVACDQAPTSVGGSGGAIATSFDSAALSGRGLLIEAGSLLLAVTLVVLTSRAQTAETDG